MSCLQKLLSTFTICIILQSIPSCHSAVFGEKCDENGETCEEHLLTCRNNTCECVDPKSMIAEEGLFLAISWKQCRIRVGHSCDPKTDLVECVKNSFCSQDTSLCQCEEGRYVDSNGNCQFKKKANKECKNNSECQTDVCEWGRCKCEPGHEFDSTMDACIPLLGADCKSQQDCPPNTICGLSEEPIAYDRETDETRKKCICDYRHSRNENGTCGLGFGRKCQTAGECGNMYLACLDGSCDCRYPLHQYYDEIFRACVSYVSGPCTPGDPKSSYFFGPIQKCTEYAHCVDKGFYSQCVCEDGYIEKGGKCFPGFGKFCNSLECQPPLFCIENKCQCHDGLQMYDKETNTCRGVEGSSCKVDDEFACVSFASCVLQGDKNSNGRCFCNKNATLTKDRTCVED